MSAISPPVAYLLPNMLAGLPGHEDDSSVVVYEYVPEPQDTRCVFELTESLDVARHAQPVDALIPGGHQVEGMSDLLAVFATEDRIRAEVGPAASPMEFLGSEWALQPQTQIYRNRMVQVANLIILNHLRDVNRTLLTDLERLNPIDPTRPQESVMLNLARATHQSWLSGEKKNAYYVAYTQAVHDALLRLVGRGLVKVPSKDEVLTVEAFLNPKKKWKITAREITADPSDQDVQGLETAMGRKFDSGFRINTVAAEWDDALSLQVSSDWQGKRPAMLYGLQADSVAAVYACLCDDKIWGPVLRGLEGGNADVVYDALVDVLRAINIGWRINNAWGGWNDPLINRPFGLKEDGGVGVEDIQKDALALLPILHTLEEARAAGTLHTFPKIAGNIERAFTLGIAAYLTHLTDQDRLVGYVRQNQRKYSTNHPRLL